MNVCHYGLLSCPGRTLLPVTASNPRKAELDEQEKVDLSDHVCDPPLGSGPHVGCGASTRDVFMTFSFNFPSIPVQGLKHNDW